MKAACNPINKQAGYEYSTKLSISYKVYIYNLFACLLEKILSSSRMISYLAAIACLVSVTIANATVYDFGNIQTRQIKPQNIPDDYSNSLKKSDFHQSPTFEKNPHRQISNIPVNQGEIFEFSNEDLSERNIPNSVEYASNASPVPEPESFTMILAGLALIGFTTRRRNKDS